MSALTPRPAVEGVPKTPRGNRQSTDRARTDGMTDRLTLEDLASCGKGASPAANNDLRPAGNLELEDRRATRRHPQSKISFAAAKTRLAAAAAELPVRCREEQAPVSAGHGFQIRRIGEWQAGGRTKVRDEQALGGPLPAVHDQNLGLDGEGARRRAIPGAQDMIATTQGQQLLVQAIGRCVGPPFVEIKLGGQEGRLRLRVRDRVTHVRIGKSAKSGELRATALRDELTQLRVE